ncbi:hypothetical protein K438DRAFT_1907621 [Mycena galopus ATCC 62051]|nr:hypothetical protein K438DRAFT_1907621 [Mycena galopus ATCC 62051]
MSTPFNPQTDSAPIPRDYPFIPAGALDRRSPCPALNTLANHGYLPRRGTHITFTHLLHAVRTVYNLSLPLALLLTLAGFLTCARFTVKVPTSSPSPSSSSSPSAAHHYFTHAVCRTFRWRWRLSISWTLDLADLSARGWNKIAHDASLVHASSRPSHAPDPTLVTSLLSVASAYPAGPREDECARRITLRDLAAVHASRERDLRHPLSSMHEQVALGECALGWLVLRNPATGLINVRTLERWYGEERLPDGWWECRRPLKPIGLLLARKMAGEVQRLAKGCS